MFGKANLYTLHKGQYNVKVYGDCFQPKINIAESKDETRLIILRISGENSPVMKKIEIPKFIEKYNIFEFVRFNHNNCGMK